MSATKRARFSRHPVAAYISGGFVALLVVVAVLGSLIAPHAPDAQNLLDTLKGPSWSHLLGTDNLGQDTLSRLIVGTRPALILTAITTLTALVIGFPCGLIAGFHGGWIERAADHVSNTVMAMPAFVMLLVVVAVFSGSLVAASLALGILVAPAMFRAVRAAAARVRSELHVEAAHVAGLSTREILWSDVTPRVLGPAAVQLTLIASGALLATAGLSFLGLGSGPNSVTWGGMVATGATVIVQQPFLIFAPGMCIFLTCIALGVLGDSMTAATSRRRREPAPARRRNERTGKAEAAAPDGDDVLVVEGLCVTRAGPAGDVALVEDLSLSVKPREIVGLVGESGSGKSVSVRAVMALLPRGLTMAGGECWLDGVRLSSLNEAAISRLRGSNMALITQEPLAALDPTCTVGRLMRELLRHHGRGSGRRQINAEIEQRLAEVNITDPRRVMHRYPHELSGGIAQRVSIAASLVGEPDLLLADEPTSALDVTVQQGILSLLRSLRDQRGLSVLFVTHDWGVVADTCDRVVVMYAGQVVESAPVMDIFDRPRHPYTAALLAANPENFAAGQMLPDIPGSVPSPEDRGAGCHFASRCEYAQEGCLRGPVELTQLGDGRAVRCVRHEELELAVPHRSDTPTTPTHRADATRG
jgi:peptide/nickel transport system permease protein